MNTIHPAAQTTLDDPRWAAVLARDSKADGRFWYSVATTGVYCRPSCASRHARPEHVHFHASPAEAEAAGFRPCKRCHPDQPPLAQRHAQLIADACRAIAAAETPPTLAALAAGAGLSTYHFHRLFKAATGLTPRAYSAGQRAEQLRQALAQGDNVTTAIYAAGYGSGSRVYERTPQLLGMTPGTFRSGGQGQIIRFALGACALGALLVAASPQGLCAIALGDDPETLLRGLQDRFPQAELVGGDAEFERWVAQVVAYIEAPRLGLNLPLDIRGTAFQRQVWQALRDIPPGSTVSYSEIARRIGAPQAVRAVAGACAANLLAVAIPCHRVVRTDGALSGYRWGVERKRALLKREKDEADG